MEIETSDDQTSDVRWRAQLWASRARSLLATGCMLVRFFHRHPEFISGFPEKRMLNK